MRRDGSRHPRGQVLDAPADLKWPFGRYLAGGDGAVPEVSPVLADLTELPPLLIQVGSSELLPDAAVRGWPVNGKR